MAFYTTQEKYSTGKDFSSHGGLTPKQFDVTKTTNLPISKSVPFGNLYYPGYQHIPVSRFPHPDAATYAEITRTEVETMTAGIDAKGKPVNEPFAPSKPGQSGWDWYKDQWKQSVEEDPVYGKVTTSLEFINNLLNLPIKAFNYLRDNPAIAAAIAILLVYKFLF